MKLFLRRHPATETQLEQGARIARDHGLPETTDRLPPGAHSVERRFTVYRARGYRENIDSTDPRGILQDEVRRVRRRCAALGLAPIFRGDYVTLHSFPRRNIITVETLGSSFEEGIKRLEQRAWFDILGYVKV
jgi:hypothetical protein